MLCSNGETQNNSLIQMPSCRGKPSILPIAEKRIGVNVHDNISFLLWSLHCYSQPPSQIQKTGPCTATCSHEAKYKTGPCTATCNRGAKYKHWSLHCHLQPRSQIQILVLALPLAAMEPNTKTGLELLQQPWSLTQQKQPCLLEFGWVREGDRASLHKASNSKEKDNLLHRDH